MNNTSLEERLQFSLENSEQTHMIAARYFEKLVARLPRPVHVAYDVILNNNPDYEQAKLVCHIILASAKRGMQFSM